MSARGAVTAGSPLPLLCGAALALALGCSDPAAKDDGPIPPLPDAGPAAVARRAAAKLEQPKGEVALLRDGARAKAAAQDVYGGDALETGADGEATLRFSGERLVELGPDGRFVLEAVQGGVALNVERGLVLTRVPAGGGGAQAQARAGEVGVLLTITTPFGITRLGGEGEVKLDVTRDSARVDVLVGEIELVGKDGVARKLGAGGTARLGEVRELPLVELRIVVAGRGELKAKDAKGWVALDARRPPKLDAGDAVRVKEGQLTLSPDGSATRVTLGKGTELVLLGSARGGGEEKTDLEVKKGDLAVSAPGGQRTRLGLGGGLAVVSEQGGQFSVRKTSEGVELTSLAGDVTVERPGAEAVKVPGGGVAEVGAKGAAVRDAQRDAVVLPSRLGLKLFQAGVPRASLAWEGPEEVKAWRVQVATEPTFAAPVVDGVVHERFVSVPLPRRGALFWRVYDGAKEHEQGSVLVAPEAAAQDLGRLRNEVPEGPEKTTIYFQDKPPTVNFTWAAEPGAARYHLVVYAEGRLKEPVAERTVGVELTASLPEGTLGEGRYLWSVTPLGAKGDELRGGRMNKLELAYDNAVPQLVIKAPKNGDPGGRAVRVSLIAPIGAKLFVNGRAVPLDAKARWEGEAAPLAGGRFVFRLVEGGNEVYTVRTVRGGR